MSLQAATGLVLFAFVLGFLCRCELQRWTEQYRLRNRFWWESLKNHPAGKR